MNRMAKWLSFAKFNSLTAFLLLVSSVAFSQNVNVTFRINTAGVPDTLVSTSTVQVRGGNAPLTWGLDSPVIAHQVSGDYWEATASFPAGSTLGYKFYTNANPIDKADGGQGWEGDLAGGNRSAVLGMNDTVLAVDWVNGWSPAQPDQHDRPLSTSDSIDVYFRVNVQGIIQGGGFDPMTQVIGVRGDDMGLTNPPISWGNTVPLMSEQPHANGGSRQYDASNFWSGSIKFPISKLGSVVNYKFVISNATALNSVVTWEDGDNKQFTLNADTSLAYRYFNNVKPVSCLGCNEDVTLNFVVDLDKAITSNGFNLETDTLYVRAGLNSTTLEPAYVKLSNTGGTTFEGTANVKAKIGANIQYAYFKVFKNAQDVRTELKEFYFDNYDPVAGSNQENRKVVAAATVDVDDTAGDNTSSHRSPYFRNTSTMAQDTKIILEIDYRPAINEVKNWNAILNDVQNANFFVDKTNIDQFSVYVNGPLTRNVDNNDWGGWTAAGLTDGRKAVDDGTGDDLVAGDSIWTISFPWTTTNDNAFVSQIFKFGINGGDNEAGYGNNHIYNVKPGEATQRVRAAFGDIQPTRYPHWNYPTATGIKPPSTVKVTFWINTAGVPDTLVSTSTVQVRGGNAPLTWGLDSPVIATHVAGDYWKAEAMFPSNTMLTYKFYTNANPIGKADGGQGWEADLANGNRNFFTGTSDISIPVEWVNGWNPAKPDQFARPLSTSDSVDVYFRVNVEGILQSNSFDPKTQVIGVRGDDMGLTNPPISWGNTVPLMPEQPHANGGSRQYDASNFWSGSVKFPVSKLGSVVNYKFVISNANALNSVVTWEDGDNKKFTLNADTTLGYLYFNGVRPKTCIGDCNVDFTLNFAVDLDKAITSNGFNIDTDTLYVRAGLNATAKEAVFVKLANTGGTTFEGTAHLTSSIGNKIQYAYFKVFKNAQDVRTELKEFYFDNYDPVAGSNQENRKIVAATQTVDVDDTAGDNTSSHRSPYFRNTSTMAQDTKIILEIDYRPAINEVKKHGAILNDVQNANFFVDASNIDQFSVYVNGPLTRNVDNNDWGGWTAAGLTDGRKAVDDGTGDDLVSGDTIWTISFPWTKTNDNAFVSQIFKFGINGGDNEAGYGNNHIYNVKAGQAEQRVRAAFGDIQPTRYPHWDYPTASPKNPDNVVDNMKADKFELGQNYPNPFNPSTVIPFSVPKAGIVRIEIYNLLGQKVLEFTENITSAGVYKRSVDASQLGSGTYLYKMTSGSFTKTNKMTLVK